MACEICGSEFCQEGGRSVFGFGIDAGIPGGFIPHLLGTGYKRIDLDLLDPSGIMAQVNSAIDDTKIRTLTQIIGIYGERLSLLNELLGQIEDERDATGIHLLAMAKELQDVTAERDATGIQLLARDKEAGMYMESCLALKNQLNESRAKIKELETTLAKLQTAANAEEGGIQG